MRKRCDEISKRRLGLGLIGVGAFGAFCRPHLDRHFTLALHDPLAAGDDDGPGRWVSLIEAASQPIVVLAVPLKALAAVARTIAPHLKPGTLVLDVCSLKTEPLAILRASLPAHVDLIGTHPLFGPASGRDGLGGLQMVLCPGQGRPRLRLVGRFLEQAFGLAVTLTSAEAHDAEMAQVQGLTHLLARIIRAMDLPRPSHTTRTFYHLMRMVDTVAGDSDELYRTITEHNPFVGRLKRQFLATAVKLCSHETDNQLKLAEAGTA